MMFRIVTILLAVTITAISAEVSSSYALLEKNVSFKPDLKTEPVETHAVFKKDNKPQERHPIYRADEHRNEGRAKIAPVRPTGPIVKHDMLADQPNNQAPSDLNRIDNPAASGYGFVTGPAEVAYPDIAYAPGYGYDNYSPSNRWVYCLSERRIMVDSNECVLFCISVVFLVIWFLFLFFYYDVYGNGPSSYLMEPDTSAFSLLWSQVPDSRTLVSYVGRTISWVFSSFFVLMLGSLLTVGVCSYTNLCTISFHGVGPIHEEMRALVTPERLEKISNAADFVKTAIDKYQKIQKVSDVTGNRNRRAIFY